MKKLTNLIGTGLTLLTVVFLASCEKNGPIGNGSVEFSINMSEEALQSKSGIMDTSIISYQLNLTIENTENGNIIDKLIPLYHFGQGYISESIALSSGDYKLTKFMIIDPSGDVLYAAPMEDSELAYLVNDPLPIDFSVNPNQTIRVTPEVLKVGNHTPEQFGYAAFGIKIIKPLAFWTVCVLDNPIIFAPYPQYTTAKLTVSNGVGWHYTFRLDDSINHLVIRGGSEVYYLLLEKEGYEPQHMQFNATQLMSTTMGDPLVLRIPWGEIHKMVLQPGPARGKDAMISNLEPDKNFGDHKYFETTFLTEPMLTVMRSNMSLINFNLDSLPESAIIKRVTLELWYDTLLSLPDSNMYLYDTKLYNSSDFAWFGGVLQQIVDPWEEYGVTWNNQPTTIEANQVYVNPFIYHTDTLSTNSIELNVTTLFVPMLETDEIAAPNYGMLFKLWPSEQFPGFRFASSDYPEPGMRPKLTVYYSL